MKKSNKTIIGTIVYIGTFLLFVFLFVALPYLIFDLKDNSEAKFTLVCLSLIVCIVFPFVANYIYIKTLQKLNIEISNKFYCVTKTYSDTNNIKMNWFSFYIKVILPIRIIFCILSVISFLGNLYGQYRFWGLSPWTDTVILALIIDIGQIFVLCYTFTKMKKLKEESFNSNIIYMIIGVISISFTYLPKLKEYGALALIPTAVYLIIWFLPNYIYFKKRKPIFGFDYQLTKPNTEQSQFDNNVYNDFDIYWTCPNCGRQNQSVKCFGCGLTKEEALNTINAEKPKQSESIPIIEAEQETSSDSTEELLSNEKIEKLWGLITPEISNKIFQNDKEKVSNIIISLSQILNINLKDCDASQYKNILNIYGKVFIWKTEKNASDKSIILSLQKYHTDYITSEDTAKKVLAFCIDNIPMNNPATESSEDATSSNDIESENAEPKFCGICGNKLDNDYAFCNKCGNKVR